MDQERNQDIPAFMPNLDDEEARKLKGRRDLRDYHGNGLNLSTYDFSGSDFEEAVFLRCDFRMTNLRGANFKGARFQHCWFDQADFTRTTLEGAIFDRCILSGVNFSEADLFQTQFSESSLRGIRLEGVQRLHDPGSRAAVGELLRQHASASGRRISIALQYGGNMSLTWESMAKLCEEEPVTGYWMRSVFRQYPASRLMEALLQREEDLRETEMAAIDPLLEIKVYPGPGLAVAKIGERSFVAFAPGRNHVLPSDFLGELVEMSADPLLQPGMEPIVDVVFREFKGFVPIEECTELYRPFPYPPKAKGQENQEAVPENRHEKAFLRKIVRAIELEEGKVWDMDAGEGDLLARLKRRKPKLELVADPATFYLSKKLKEEIPQFRLESETATRQDSKAPEIPADIDIAVHRFLRQSQWTSSEIENEIQVGMRSLRPGGKLILCPQGAVALSSTFLAPHGQIEESVWFDGERLMTWFVLVKD